MEIVAKTKEGYLINATSPEIKSILTAVLGSVDMEKIGIGTKIPAIDYATTISKMKVLKDSAYFKNVGYYLSSFLAEYNELKDVIDQVPPEM